jgi:hypothetical protein
VHWQKHTESLGHGPTHTALDCCSCAGGTGTFARLYAFPRNDAAVMGQLSAHRPSHEGDSAVSGSVAGAKRAASYPRRSGNNPIGYFCTRRLLQHQYQTGSHENSRNVRVHAKAIESELKATPVVSNKSVSAARQPTARRG